MRNYFMFAFMAFALTANAEQLETDNTEQKSTVEVPQWIKNIKFSG